MKRMKNICMYDVKEISLLIYFLLLFGLANAINDYLRLNICVECLGNLKRIVQELKIFRFLKIPSDKCNLL